MSSFAFIAFNNHCFSTSVPLWLTYIGDVDIKKKNEVASIEGEGITEVAHELFANK